MNWEIGSVTCFENVRVLDSSWEFGDVQKSWMFLFCSWFKDNQQGLIRAVRIPPPKFWIRVLSVAETLLGRRTTHMNMVTKKRPSIETYVRV